jgi:hypothetical protein
MPASWITFAHFGISAFIRALELIRRHGRRLISCCRHFLLEVRRSNRTRDLAVQKIVDLVWRTGGCPDTLRCLLHLAGHTGFSIVGTSGRITIRFVLVTASARSRPSLICADADGSVASATGVWPPTTDCTIGPPPPNGTVTMSSLSDSLNSSVDRCGGVPAPAILNIPLKRSVPSQVWSSRISCTIGPWHARPLWRR